MTMGRANRNDVLDIIIRCHERWGIPIDQQCKEWGNIVRERDVLREIIKRRAGLKPRLGEAGRPLPEFLKRIMRRDRSVQGGCATDSSLL